LIRRFHGGGNISLDTFMKLKAAFMPAQVQG